jgi:DNA-binding response OmpR family regulator
VTDGLRILIVEDEQIIAADLADKLAHLGHEVLGIAMAGEEAVELAEQLNPDLVLMDIQLEGAMRGTEAAVRIRGRTNARVIFITAFPNALLHDSIEIPKPGICLGKPFSRAQLEASIRAVTEQDRRAEPGEKSAAPGSGTSTGER